MAKDITLMEEREEKRTVQEEQTHSKVGGHSVSPRQSTTIALRFSPTGTMLSPSRQLSSRAQRPVDPGITVDEQMNQVNIFAIAH